MKKNKLKIYKQKTDDCWRVAFSNYLQVSPKKIPHFLNEFPTDWIKATRDWLKKKFKKGLVFVTAETIDTHDWNGKLESPDGRCIIIVGFTNDSKNTHAIFLKNGKLLQNHSISKYDKVVGYFFIYDL